MQQEYREEWLRNDDPECGLCEDVVPIFVIIVCPYEILDELHQDKGNEEHGEIYRVTIYVTNKGSAKANEEGVQ